MTAAYDLFVRELQAQGRERLDGLSLGNLLQLPPDEHALVVAQLEQGLARRDPRVPIALAVMEPGASTVALLRAAAPLSGPGPAPAPASASAPGLALGPGQASATADHFVLEVAAALGVLEGAPDALNLLEQALRSATEPWARGIATDGLRRALPTSDASARLGRMLRTLESEDLRIEAADTLLQRHGWRIEDVSRKAETLQLMRALIGADGAGRDAALVKVLKTPVKSWPT